MHSDPLAHPEQAIRRLYGYVAYRIGRGPDAEDVVSETIERALRYRDSYEATKGPSAAWLTTIASHVIADRARALKAEREIEAEREGSAEDFSDRTVQRLDMQAAMRLVDDRTRELLALRYGADLKAREIAQLLGWRTNAVEVALHRALSRLRQVLDESPPPLRQRTRRRAVVEHDW